MANEKEVKLIITAEDNVSSAIKKISAALGESGLAQGVTAASTAFSALKDAGELVVAAFDKVAAQFDRAIHAASEMELTNKKLALSLINSGEFTKESFDSIMEWSDGVENATGVSNEFALNLVVLGKNMGMTAERSQVAAQAAMDMAAATGIDANAALRQLNMTLNGTAGRLGMMIPEVGALTKAQLASGEAIKLISEKYKNFASETANTFSGAQAKLKAQIENVYEAFGRMIVQNPIVISAMTKVAEIFHSVAKAIDSFSSFVLNNIDQIKTYAIAFAIVAGALGIYMAVINAATIAQTALTAATIIYNTVSLLTPWGLAIAGIAALTAGVAYLINNWAKISAVTQEYAGILLQKIMPAIEFVMQGFADLVSIFDSEWAKSIETSIQKIKDQAVQMEMNGKKAGEMADAHKNAGKDTVDAADAAGMAIKGLGDRATQAAQAAKLVSTEYAKAASNAEDAFKALKDLTPRIQLAQFKQDSALWESQIKTLQEKANAMKLQLQAKMGPASKEDEAQLREVEQKIVESQEAMRALKIKNAQEVRQAQIKEVDIQLAVEKANTISVVDEIKLKRIDAAQSVRNTLIQIETERLLQERNLADVNTRAGVDVKTQAQLNANQTELTAYKANLDAQLALSVSMEEQKQSALAAARASATAGLGGAAEAGGAADATVAKEQERQSQLTMLKQQGLMTDQQYERAITASRVNEVTARNQVEIELHKQRSEQLGLTEAGLAERQAVQQTEYETNLAALQEHHDARLMTDAEFAMAQQQAELENKAQMSAIGQQYTEDEIRRYELLGDQWSASLAKVRLEQQKHGVLLGTVRGIQQTQEFQATNQMMSDLGSLRNSKNKEAFEIGKKAAIAQATVNTFMSATAAYASLVGIPIVGPALAVAAAAAAVAAGFVNIQNIASQKFSAGGQADEGIDNIPASMSGKSFIVSGGERILQPEANKDMTKAADTINKGGGGMTANISVVINGTPSASQVDQLKESIIDALRSASERGTPIIHEKGVVKAS